MGERRHMAEFHLAGKANDPAVADAEVVIQDLAMNLPDITLVSHIKDPDQWPQWSVELCQRMGFDEATYAAGPIIWASGRIVGDHSDLKLLTQRIYGRCQTKDYAELEVLAQENLRLCKERDAKQAERQARLTGLREEETTASARIGVLTKQLEELKPVLERAVKHWESTTHNASVLVQKMCESGALRTALESESPSRKMRKLVTLICRAMAPESKDPVSILVNSVASPDQMNKWMQIEPPSVLLSRDSASLSKLAATLKRAAQDLAQSASEDSAKKPPAEWDEGPEPALQHWCEAVVKLSEWDGLSKFGEQLLIQQSAQAELLQSEANLAVVLQQVDQMEVEIEDASDPYDAVPGASS